MLKMDFDFDFKMNYHISCILIRLVKDSSTNFTGNTVVLFIMGKEVDY